MYLKFYHSNFKHLDETKLLLSASKRGCETNIKRRNYETSIY